MLWFPIRRRRDIGIADVADPVAGRDEAIVAFRVSSVNRGELRKLAQSVPGTINGWDFAGVVVEPCAGYDVGERVVGTSERGGCWAEKIAVAATRLAPLPVDVGFEAAAALPVAGLTALRMVRTVSVLGRSVLITGASSGVGLHAVQLAKLAGGHVTVFVSERSRFGPVERCGAERVVVDLDELDAAYDLILDDVGGETLGRVVTRVAPRCTLVMYGNSSNEPTTFDVRDVLPGPSRVAALVSPCPRPTATTLRHGTSDVSYRWSRPVCSTRTLSTSSISSTSVRRSPRSRRAGLAGRSCWGFPGAGTRSIAHWNKHGGRGVGPLLPTVCRRTWGGDPAR